MGKTMMTTLCLLAFVAGCATGPQPKWYHPYKTEQDFKQDIYACQQDAALYTSAKRGRAHLELTYEEILLGGLVGDAKVLEEKRFKLCMQSKGYELRVEESKISSSKVTEPTRAPPPTVKSSEESTSKKLFKTEIDNFGVWYDESKWKLIKTNTQGKGKSVIFQLIGENAVAMVITQRIELTISSLKKNVLNNFQEVGEDFKVIFEEKGVVNGCEILCLQLTKTIDKIPYKYYGYYYSGKERTIQVITSTGKNLFGKYEKELNNFLNGLVISPLRSR